MNQSTEQKFWDRVKCGNAEVCWPWQGPLSWNGYGRVWTDDKRERSHRVAYLLSGIGDLDSGKFCLHTCDNRACCNPAHLFAGTQKENIRDCIDKGRFAVGERNGRARLARPDILKIVELHSSGMTKAAIARRFKVSESNVRHIVKGDGWKSVERSRQ